jgi:hypothetical protein
MICLDKTSLSLDEKQLYCFLIEKLFYSFGEISNVLLCLAEQKGVKRLDKSLPHTIQNYLFIMLNSFILFCITMIFYWMTNSYLKHFIIIFNEQVFMPCIKLVDDFLNLLITTTIKMFQFYLVSPMIV